MSSLDAITGTGVYAKEIGGTQAAPSAFVEATVATTPASLDEEVMVLVGAEASQLQAGPCRWEPRVVANGLLFPQRGDACLVVTGDQGHRAIVWWKPSAAPSLPFTGAPHVTALPASPVDGQTIAYLADDTSGVVWHLKYRSASASAYKWECIGGTPLRSNIEAVSTTTATTYADLVDGLMTTLAVPLAGVYEVQFSARPIPPQVANAAAWVGPALGSTVATDGNSVPLQTPTADGALVSPVGRTLRPTLAAADVITLKFRTSTGTAQFANRDLRIKPVRVG